jgi:hypothetical protein
LQLATEVDGFIESAHPSNNDLKRPLIVAEQQMCFLLSTQRGFQQGTLTQVESVRFIRDSLDRQHLGIMLRQPEEQRLAFVHSRAAHAPTC